MKLNKNHADYLNNLVLDKYSLLHNSATTRIELLEAGFPKKLVYSIQLSPLSPIENIKAVIRELEKISMLRSNKDFSGLGLLIDYLIKNSSDYEDIISLLEIAKKNKLIHKEDYFFEYNRNKASHIQHESLDTAAIKPINTLGADIIK